jgi:hypothetical protein
MSSPYISVVVTTRNDNYGENMQRRLDMFVCSLDHYQKKYPNLFELVVVEWNPPSDRGPLFEILPTCTDLPIRVITVPKVYHDMTGLTRPLAEWPAKNIGLIRSQSEFVLITNPDILMSPALVEYLARRELVTDVVYRCDRYDFDGTGIESVDPAQYVSFAFTKIFKLHGMHHQNSLTVPVDLANNGNIPISTYNEHTVHTNGAGDFMLINKTTAQNAGGFYQGAKCQGHGDSVSMYRFMHRGVQQGLFKFPAVTLHQDHDRNVLPSKWNPSEVIETAQQDDSDDWGLVGVELNEWRNNI